ncbi:MAG: hypothetical protein SPK65_09290 [Succinivibrio dextrinosolvens]|jgi:hypothetical protein|uniref:hypothetical protein n=1 Tax=Succinivibrio dextrinosolvens TaxID=83771 RepID=UPI0008E9BEBF|nr:hypothetical protein [Succinivibrio dextrinosolvens]MDY6466776.1 hypothetical protein [Succinivibrio dextrinosolvens]SFS34629.1 hypothetical protein SAMN02910357_00251 [Succinivibrio dextrinosolvens]
MSYLLILVIAIPVLFVIGTTYNALKEQKRLEEGPLKEILSKREQEKREALRNSSKIKDNNK